MANSSLNLLCVWYDADLGRLFSNASQFFFILEIEILVFPNRQFSVVVVIRLSDDDKQKIV